jgi:hypothetical protein
MLRKLMKVMCDALADQIMELERDNEHLRAEIDVLQRMRHKQKELGS